MAARDNLPTAPQNFDNIPRYVSNLPVDRVKDLRNRSKSYLDMCEMIKQIRSLTDEETAILLLAGFIDELTQPNEKHRVSFDEFAENISQLNNLQK